MLARLSQWRADGHRLVIVTGRILGELLAEFPQALAIADVIVAEYGAILATAEGVAIIAEPVSHELEHEVLSRLVPVRRGVVLLACRARDADTVVDAVRRLGLEYQLVFNRSEMMILPPGAPIPTMTGGRTSMV